MKFPYFTRYAIRFLESNQLAVLASTMYTISMFGGLILQSKDVCIWMLIPNWFDYKLTNTFVLNAWRIHSFSKQLIESKDILGIIKVIIWMWGSLFPFFLFCHFGGNITAKFENIGDSVYQLEWYRLSLGMQKDLKTVIAISQKGIFMRGYGDMRTTQSVFKKV